MPVSIFYSLLFVAVLLAGPVWGQEEPTQPAPPQAVDTPLATRLQDLEEQLQRLLAAADARQSIAPDAERQEVEQEQLEAARQAAEGSYTLLPKGRMRLSYGCYYGYYSNDVVEEFERDGDGITVFVLNHAMEHSLTNAISADYGLFNNLTVNSSVPFVYKYDEVSKVKGSNLGDISLGLQYQPLLSRRNWPSLTITSSASLPTGTSPYEVNSSEEFATGSGYYSFSGGVNLSKSIEPLVAYGNLSYTWRPIPVRDIHSHGRDIDALHPGDSLSLSAGIAFALSYGVSLDLGYMQRHDFGSELEINGERRKSVGQNQGVFSVGTAWRLSPGQYLSVSLGMGLTPQSPDLSVNVRLPFEFQVL